MNEFKNKIITIMRGLPGSGKSTKAKELSQKTGAIICSTDDFFMIDGKYVFDSRKLGINHMRNHEKVKNLMKENNLHIIVDNTNIVRKDFSKYVQMAKEYGYEVEYVIVECDVETSIARNTHNVPPDVIRKMAARFQMENEIPAENV